MKSIINDKIRGSLFGGAVGDALGYPVEFLSLEEIKSVYGEKGITKYKLDRKSGKALISDDTQMTLFTADGLLIGDTRITLVGVPGKPSGYVSLAYGDWYKTQTCTFGSIQNRKKHGEYFYTWLTDVPELYSQRSPGNTCMGVLEGKRFGGCAPDERINNSKGCGGIMRVVPVALMYYDYFGKISKDDIDRETADVAALTHGHSLGFMPAAIENHVICNILTKPEMNLKDNIFEALETVKRIFKGDRHLDELSECINNAVKFSENDKSDEENIGNLGGGWVAEETLAISLYCALRYQNDFSKAVIAAVNHSGDSDSTGAVTGNIVGAIVGYRRIEEKWKKELELSDIILEIADDLFHKCKKEDRGEYYGMVWEEKYIKMHKVSKEYAKHLKEMYLQQEQMWERTREND